LICYNGFQIFLFMKPKIAIIGCGNWGKNIIRNFAELGNLYAVSDIDNDKAKYFSKLYGIKNLSLQELLHNEKIDGVVIASPVSYHAELSIAFLKAGKHVLVEKPLAMNSKEGEQMIKIAKQQNKKLMVGHLLQYHPVFNKLNELIEEGDILGKVRYIYSNRLNFGAIRHIEDVLWCLGTHDVSMILRLTGQMPDKISAEGVEIIQSDILDKAQINLSFKCGIKAHINVSWVNPFKEHKMVVVGDTGMAVFDDTQDWNNKLLIYPHAIDPSEKPIKFEKFEPRTVLADKAEPLRNECSHFIDIITNPDLEPFTDGAEGLRVLNVLDEASKIIRNKRN